MALRGPIVVAIFTVLALTTAACDDDSTVAPDGGAGVRSGYSFESRFTPGAESVSHGGQTTRQILLTDLASEMVRLAEGVRDGTIDPTDVDEEGEVVARLNAFYRSGSSDLGTRPLPNLVENGDATCEMTFEDLGSANLMAKTAGEDTVTDHKDWTTEFVGWSDSSVVAGAPIGSPVALVDAFFVTFENQVRACALAVEDCPATPAGEPLPLYVTPDGLDLAQLVQKHLLGAVHFSQGTDDYLDDDVDGKGLLTDNVTPHEDGAASTTLEHAWDEAFGYFGAAADYDDYTDDEIRAAGGRPEYASGYHDTNGDLCIDVFAEYNWSASVNAAKRDAGSTTMTDLTAEVFGAFVAGRTVITEAGGVLDESQNVTLRTHRDAVATAWEEALGATVIHYINDVRADLGTCGGDDYSFADHAKHWSELKGFALSFQYNPRSPWNAGSDFAALHVAIGDSPVLCDGDTTAHDAALLAARDSVRDAYGFDATDAENW
ncbi:MAG: DUF4856 domain-containing protein [Deltaproteobacteria bacterium]|nr:DUF4856 domain-containing protein [Deltaproteobacteria bacterium]